jgi:hypothetical protein
MAKVDGCDLSKIGRFGKTLDFYYWKGILCVRMFPRKAKQPGTPDQLKTWEALRYANAEFNRLAQQERDAFKFLSNPSQMSGRDLFLKMILEEYRGRGESLCRIQIRMDPFSEDSFRITLTKSVNAPVLLAGLTEQDKARCLEWEEITPILRGKKLLRRWNLIDHIEDATYCSFVPKESPTFEDVVFYESGIRYLTAKAVIQLGGGYGRAGLYSVYT